MLVRKGLTIVCSCVFATCICDNLYQASTVGKYQILKTSQKVKAGFNAILELSPELPTAVNTPVGVHSLC
jgi:hypothetical protein